MSNKYQKGESDFPLNDCYVENQIKAEYVRKCVYPRNSLPTLTEEECYRPLSRETRLLAQKCRNLTKTTLNPSAI